MTSAENTVTKPGMLAAADRMQLAKSNVERERSEVEAAITRLFGTFTGGAALSYRRAMTNWFGNVETITTELDRMTKVMRDGAELIGKGDTDTTDYADDMDRQIAGLGGL